MQFIKEYMWIWVILFFLVLGLIFGSIHETDKYQKVWPNFEPNMKMETVYTTGTSFSNVTILERKDHLKDDSVWFRIDATETSSGKHGEFWVRQEYIVAYDPEDK